MSIHGRILSRLRRDTRGSSLIEFAATAPVLLLMIFGITQIGITYNNYIMLTDAVRAGARQLSTGRATTNPCQGARNRVYAAAPGLAQANLPVTMSLNGATVSGNTCANTALVAGQDAMVSGTYPCSLVIFGVNFAPGGCTLSASTTTRIE